MNGYTPHRVIVWDTLLGRFHHLTCSYVPLSRLDPVRTSGHRSLPACRIPKDGWQSSELMGLLIVTPNICTPLYDVGSGRYVRQDDPTPAVAFSGKPPHQLPPHCGQYQLLPAVGPFSVKRLETT